MLRLESRIAGACVNTRVGDRVSKFAAKLRSGPGDSRQARLIPVGGGKGGVGKSFIVANLAASLARMGHRVIAVDGDLEGPNLHTCVGISKPQASLADFVAQREEDLGKLILDTPIPNLQLIAATDGNLATPQPTQSRRVRLMRGLRELDADFVFLDLGAGTHAAVMDYFMIGDDGLIVIAPEPTSVENAYGFVRAAFYRRLRLAMASHDMRKIVTIAMDQRNERGIRTPLELLREIERSGRGQALRRNDARVSSPSDHQRCSHCRRHQARLFDPERMSEVLRDRSRISGLRESRQIGAPQCPRQASAHRCLSAIRRRDLHLQNRPQVVGGWSGRRISRRLDMNQEGSI